MTWRNRKGDPVEVEEVRWVDEGHRIYVPVDDRGLHKPAVVVTAAGYHARVRTMDGQERWVDIRDCVRVVGPKETKVPDGTRRTG